MVYPATLANTIPGETERTDVRSRWRARAELACVAAAMALVAWFYHWTVAANSGFDNWGDLDYFRLLVRGWQKGHLYIDKVPSYELLALADPYDPAHNAPFKMGDVSLYQNRYYLYFGAVPAAAVMLPFAVITGREMTTGTAVLAFCLLAFFAASGLWLAVRRRYFPNSNLAMAPLGVLAIGFGTHLLALAQRPWMWELPIAGGVAFTLLAVIGGYRAIHGRRPLANMAFAGLCLGLAVGSRPTCLLAAPLLLAPIWLAWREARPGHCWWRMAIAAAVPLGLCGLAIMAHNYARFDNVFEFGQDHQLSGAYESKLTHFSFRYLVHNFGAYFFFPLEWTPEFPFAGAQLVPIPSIQGYLGSEEIGGLVVTFPFFAFVCALPLAWWRRDRNDARRLMAVVACIGGYAVAVMLLILSYFSTTARYQTDFAVGLAVLALCGMLALERWAQGVTAQRRVVRSVTTASAATLCAVTAVVGVLLSFDYHARSLQRSAPTAWQALDRATNRALTEIAGWFGQLPGPRVLKVRFQPRPAGTIETFWQSSDLSVGERILVEHVGDHLIRFGYARGSKPVQWGRELKWETDHTHTVHVQLPSLYPAVAPGLPALRGRVQFRERTSVAVWFSGGRALGLVVEPRPRGTAEGGAVGRDFSGEVRKITTRLWREDEIGMGGLVEPHAPRGGVLRMRLVLPDRLQPAGDPLFAAGAHYRSSIVYLRAAEGGVRFVYENYGTTAIESEIVRPVNGELQVELELPSCRPESFGEERTGDVVIRVGGREVLRTVQVTYPSPWGDEQIGRNPFGTTCAAEFRGWLLDARWSAADRRGQ